MFASFFVGAVIATIPAGWLSDTHDTKLIVTISICFTTVGCFLSPITAMKGGYIGLVVLRFIMGLFGQVRHKVWKLSNVLKIRLIFSL